MSDDDLTPPEDLDDPIDIHASEALASDVDAVPGQVGLRPDPDGAAGEDHITLEQFDALLTERDDLNDRYLRTAAEFDNFRKQAQKRLADEVVRSQGGFVERMLPVLDAIEAAQTHGGDDAGVEAVSKALFGFLEKEGLERVAPAGEPFDPNVAEAVVHEPGDGEPMVAEVLRTGYLWQGRVIRAAMVKVVG